MEHPDDGRACEEVSSSLFVFVLLSLSKNNSRLTLSHLQCLIFGFNLQERGRQEAGKEGGEKEEKEKERLIVERNSKQV